MLENGEIESSIQIAHAAAGASKNAGAKHLGALLSKIEESLIADDLAAAQNDCRNIGRHMA